MQEEQINKSNGEEESSVHPSDSRKVTGSKRKTRLVFVAATSVVVVGLSALGAVALYTGQMDRLYESCVVMKPPVASFNTQADAQTVLGQWEIDDEGELRDSSSEFVYDGNRLEMFSAAQIEDFQFSFVPEYVRYKTSLETVSAVWPSVRDSVGDLKNTPDGQKYLELESLYRKAALDHLEIQTILIQITTDAVIRGELVTLPKGLERESDLLVERQEELEVKAKELAKQISTGEAFAKFQRNMDDLTGAINEVREVCKANNFGSRSGQR